MTTGRIDAVFGDGGTALPRTQRKLVSFSGPVATRRRKPQDAPSDSGTYAQPAEQNKQTDESKERSGQHGDNTPVPPKTEVNKVQNTEKAVDSHQPAFDAFFLRYEQPLYGYLRRMLPSQEIALELAQETFFRAWQHFDELQTYDRPESWLYRVATNLAISHMRRKKSLPFSQVFRRTNDEGEPDEGPTDYEFLSDAFDMEQQTANRDMIEKTLQKLPERQRAALLLRVVYGLSCEEIGETLGISVPNVRQTLSRGRERFRKLYRANNV